MIGIILRSDVTPSKREVYVAYKAINDVIRDYNEIGIGILPNSFNQISKILDLCAGIILQGGDDFTNLDLDIVAYLHNKNIPTLGICLGMQSMAYLFGGTIARLNNDKHLNENHDVIIKNSKIYEDKVIKVNSRHHDYIINTNLDVTGISRDNIIEMVEDKNKDFFVGVEWHPENIYKENSDAKKLFDKFFEVVKSKKKH